MGLRLLTSASIFWSTASEKLSRALTVSLALAVLGCAPNTELNQTAASDVHSVAIAGCQHPMQYLVMSVSITHKPWYVQRLDEELQQRHLDIGGDLQRAFARALVAKGYEVKDSPADADATLACTSLLAFYDGGMFGTSYTPSVQLDVALTDRSSHTVFARRYFYTGDEPPMGVTGIRSNPQYNFASDDAVVADPERAAAGLRAAVPLLASAVTDALPKR